MTSNATTFRRRGVAVIGALALAAGTLFAGNTASAADPVNPLPVFEFGGIITDKETLEYNPTEEFIFPSIFHAGEHFENPLGEWYLYYAPHDDPGGVSMVYSDSLEGPWTEYESNPIIANQWLPHYDTVPHVSSPDAFWHEGEQTMFMYFHGNNSVTRFATSDDGVTFEYGGEAVTNAQSGPGTTQSSYARVFEHPDETSEYNYAMFYMDGTPQNIRRIRLAESVDARDWDVRAEPLVVPGSIEGQNVSSANLWEWDGQLYVIYHASSGMIHARATNPSFTELGPTLELHKTTGVGDDSGRVASPDIITFEGETYLFYEAGHRLGATIAYAKLNPDLVREVPEQHPDPSWENCPGAGSDEFDGTELDRDLWPHMVREDLAGHSVADGELIVPTYHAGVNGAPLIQKELPDGAWEATTKLDFTPTASFQQAGLLVYRNDTNYAKFDVLYGTNGLRLEFIWRNNGTDRNTGFDSVAPSAEFDGTAWLRVTSDGTNLTASVSYDGVSYAPFGRPVTVATLDADRIGPYAMRGATAAPEIEAAFDWFRWSPTDAELEACAPDELVVNATATPGAPNGANGWYRGPVTVVLAAQGGSGAISTEYNLGDGWIEYTGPVTVASDGIHQFSYRATADDESTEPGLLVLSIDSTVPVVTPEADERNLTLDAQDDGSGIELVEYRFTGGDWLEYAGTISVENSATTIEFRATDAAGNTSAVGEFAFAAVPAEEEPGEEPAGDDENLAVTGGTVNTVLVLAALGLLVPGIAIAAAATTRRARRLAEHS